MCGSGSDVGRIDHNAVKSELLGVTAVTCQVRPCSFGGEQRVIDDLSGALPVADYDGWISSKNCGIDRHELKGDSTRRGKVTPKCKYPGDSDTAQRNLCRIRR